MKPYDIIKHNNFMDVACRILKMTRYDGGYSLRIAWINRAFVDSFNIGIERRIDIKDGDLQNWSVCLEPNEACIRNAKWKRLK